MPDEVGRMQTVLSAETEQHDKAIEESAQKVTASSRKITAEVNARAEAEVLAAKLVGTANDEAARKYVAAMRTQTAAAADYRSARRLAKSDGVDAAKGFEVEAAALSKLTATRVEAKAAAQALAVSSEAASRAAAISATRAGNSVLLSRVAGSSPGDALQVRYAETTLALKAAKQEEAEVTAALAAADTTEATAKEALAVVTARVTAAEEANAAAKSALVDRSELAAKALRDEAAAAQVAARAASAPVTSTANQAVTRATLERAAAQRELKATTDLLNASTASEAEKEAVLAPVLERNRLATLELSKAEAAMAEQKASLSSALGSYRGALSLAGTVGAFAAVAGLKSAVSESLEFGRAIQQASEKTGLAIGTLSTLHYAAGVMGIDFERVTVGVDRMGKAIGEATEGNKKTTAFLQSLGLNAKELAGRSDGAEIAFKRFAQTLAATESPIRRVELATGLLGRAGAEQIPLLIQLGNNWDYYKQKAEEAGVQLDGKTAASLLATNQKLEDMRQRLHGAELAFTEGLIPGINAMLNVLTQGQGQMNVFQAWGSGIARAMALAASAVYGLASASRSLGASMDSVDGRSADAAAGWARVNELSQKAEEFRNIAVNGPQSAGPKTDKDKLLGFLNGDGQPTSGAGSGIGFSGVGDLTDTAEKENEKRLKAMEAGLAQLKINGNVTAKAEFEYWQERIGQFTVGSNQYNAIVEKEAQIVTEGARRASEIVKQAKQLMKKQDTDSGAAEALRSINEVNENYIKSLQEMDKARETQADAANEVAAIRSRAAATEAETRINEESGRSITRQDAARQLAFLHAQQYSAQIEALNAKAIQVANASYLTSPEKAAQLRQIQEQGTNLEVQRQAQIAHDQNSTNPTDSSPFIGAEDAINEFAEAARNNAKQMQEFITQTISKINSTLVEELTHRHRRGDHEFRNMGADLFRSGTGALLNKGEGDIAGLFPFAKGKADGSPSNPLHVLIANMPNLSIPGIQPGLGDAAQKSLGGAPMTPEAVSKMLYPNGLGGSAVSAAAGIAGSATSAISNFLQTQSASAPAILPAGAISSGYSQSDINSMLYPYGTGDGSVADPSASVLYPNLPATGGSSTTGYPSNATSNAIGNGVTGAVGALLHLIPGFATGTGPLSEGTMAMVGENGPELAYVGKGEGIVPNQQVGNALKGMGGDTHHWNIDARGSSDPAAVEAAVQRGIRAAAPRIVGQSVVASADQRKRSPAMARKY